MMWSYTVCYFVIAGQSLVNQMVLQVTLNFSVHRQLFIRWHSSCNVYFFLILEYFAFYHFQGISHSLWICTFSNPLDIHLFSLQLGMMLTFAIGEQLTWQAHPFLAQRQRLCAQTLVAHWQQLPIRWRMMLLGILEGKWFTLPKETCNKMTNF